MTATEGLRKTALRALSWSIVQNWGGRLMATLIFLLLARLLRPDDFGVASTAFLFMSFLSMIAELGFGDAIVQRQNLTPEQLNLPFWTTMAVAVLLSISVAYLASPIAETFHVARLAPYIIGAATLCPLMMLVAFQEALYRRALRFRALALRTFVGIALGGAVGISFAYAGLGPWSIIAQFGTQTISSLIFLWSRSDWRPGLTCDLASFKALAAFGSSMVGMRVVDFATQRSVDIIILMKFGTAALGLFAVSSRLFQLLMQLFQASIANVGLSVLSKVTEDNALIARLFVRSSSISAMLGTPVFFGLAALAPEVNLVMFGPGWAGASPLMRPLLLVGGIFCIQFTMGTYLAALGQPRILLRLMILKAAIVLPAVLLVPARSVAELTTIFVVALLAELPFILHATLTAIRMDWREIVRPVGLLILANFLALILTEVARYALPLPHSPFIRLVILGVIFTLAFAITAVPLSVKAIADNFRFVRQVIR